MDDKKINRGIGIVTISMIAIIVIVFIALSSNSHLAKGTYSVGTTCSDFYDGPTCRSMGCIWSVSNGCTGTLGEINCEVNQYLYNKKCYTCPSGYKSSGGSIPVTSCYISCAKNTYIASTGASSCTECPSGRKSNGGTVSFGSTSSCSCQYSSQENCESKQQTGRKCTMVSGCYVLDPNGCKDGYTEINGICAPSSPAPTCSSDRTYYPTGQPECESKSNGYVCSCDLKFCCKVTSIPLGGNDYECSNPGGFKGTCGQNTLRVCHGGGSFSCKLDNTTYNYTCVYEGTDANGFSISNCTLNSSDPTPSDPTPSDPTPSDPTPSDPTPSNPTPSDPTPSNPTPSDPTPSNPTPSDPTPSDPTPSDPTPSQPIPSNPRTGTMAIVFAWALGLGTLIYALWYFKKTVLLSNKQD